MYSASRPLFQLRPCIFVETEAGLLGHVPDFHEFEASLIDYHVPGGFVSILFAK
jgi:hypothetical protein